MLEHVVHLALGGWWCLNLSVLRCAGTRDTRVIFDISTHFVACWSMWYTEHMVGGGVRYLSRVAACGGCGDTPGDFCAVVQYA